VVRSCPQMLCGSLRIDSTAIENVRSSGCRSASGRRRRRRLGRLAQPVQRQLAMSQRGVPTNGAPLLLAACRGPRDPTAVGRVHTPYTPFCSLIRPVVDEAPIGRADPARARRECAAGVNVATPRRAKRPCPATSRSEERALRRAAPHFRPVVRGSLKRGVGATALCAILRSTGLGDVGRLTAGGLTGSSPSSPHLSNGPSSQWGRSPFLRPKAARRHPNAKRRHTCRPDETACAPVPVSGAMTHVLSGRRDSNSGPLVRSRPLAQTVL